MTNPKAMTGDIVETFEAWNHMKNNADYIRRGRSWETAETDYLLAEWIRATKAWCQNRTLETELARDDAASELQLRGIALPEEEVKSEMAELRAKVAKGHIDQSPIKALTDEFLEDYRKPTN